MSDPVNRIAIVLDGNGEFARVVSDVPVRVFIVDDNCPRDRVYELTTSLQIGPDKVRAVLRDDPIGHALDGLGTGHGPRKRPSRPALRPVEDV